MKTLGHSHPFEIFGISVQMRKPFKKEADNYTLFGVLFGFCFPIIATLIRVLAASESFTLTTILYYQLHDPLLWIIDTAPIFLGLFARFGGIRQDKLNSYARNLADQVEQRTRQLHSAHREIDDIMQNVPIALFTINADMSINRGRTSYFNSLIHQNHQATCYYPEILKVDKHTITQFQEWLTLLFSSDSPGWPVLKELSDLDEIALQHDQSIMYLEVSYYPIYRNKKLLKLMVILYDVSNQKKLKELVEEEKKGREEDIEQIAEIIRLDSDTFESYSFESKKLVTESLRVLDSVQETLTREQINDLMRKMHTLKGNAKIFNFNQINSLAHRVEDTLVLLRDSNDHVGKDQINQVRHQTREIEAKLNSIIELAKNLALDSSSDDPHISGDDIFVKVQQEKLLNLVSLSDELQTCPSPDKPEYSLIIADIIKGIEGLHTCPANRLFDRFPKMVKNLSTALGKKVTLNIAGSTIEVDLQLLDNVGTAIVHLIRNAVDHGLEKPGVRKRYQKNEQGIMNIALAQDGATLVFTISDDGQGINTKTVLEKAIEKDILTADQAEKLTETEIYNLLFLPGFSTAKQITDISGRGVGMDVVAEVINNFDGTLTISSQIRKGTTIILTFPHRNVYLYKEKMR